MYQKIAISLLTASVLTATANADVTIAHDMQIEATGLLSMMGAHGTMTQRVSGDRSYTENSFESGAGILAKSMDMADIVRLDRGVTWHLVPAEQEYTEVDFAQAREQMQDQLRSLEEQRGTGEEGLGLPVNSEDCQWSPAQISVNRTGETERIAGKKAEQNVVVVSQTCTEPESGTQCEVAWVMESWLAKKLKGSEELEEFGRAYAEELGLDEIFQGGSANQMAQPLMAMFSEGWDDARDELAELKGYPMKTVLQMEMGGEQCITQAGQPIAMDDIWNQAATAGMESAGQSIASQAGRQVGQEIGGSVGGAAGAAAAGAAISGMFKKFGRKKKEEEEQARKDAEAAAAGPTPSSRVVLFRITQEVSYISDDGIPAEKFEVPEGWTLKGN